MVSKVKVIEAPREIYWETTHEGTFDIDGIEVDFRYNENPNGVNLYIFEEELGWTNDPSDDMGETYDILYEMLSCGEISVNDDFECGEEFEWEIE
jgi:hypothetical protein